MERRISEVLSRRSGTKEAVSYCLVENLDDFGLTWVLFLCLLMKRNHIDSVTCCMLINFTMEAS